MANARWKTNQRKSVMKKRNLIAFAAAAILLAACIPSVNPFYTDKDVVFDQKLLGEWQEKGSTNNPEMWTFEQGTNNAFKLTIVESGKKGEFDAHLFKLKQAQFLDLIPSDCNYVSNQAELVGASMFPGHLLMYVSEVEPELKIALCDFDWLQKFLTENPKALEHHREGDRIVLTADTRALQKFVLKHLGTNELFKEPGEMVRVTAK
jgi:hypothetical protein